MQQISKSKVKLVIANKKSSYDEEDTDNYFEDRQELYNGTQEHPEFTKQHVLVRNKEKNLKGDLMAAGFSADIVSKANEIFCNMESGLRRGTRRRQLMFYCVHQAHKELGIPEDPTKLALQCGITTAEISKANSMCSPAKTNYRPVQVQQKPEDFISMHLTKLQELNILTFSDSTLEEITNICREVLQKNSVLRDEKPQTVAAAVVVFYLQMNGIMIDKKRYQEIFSKSDMTIGKIKKVIDVAYNS